MPPAGPSIEMPAILAVQGASSGDAYDGGTTLREVPDEGFDDGRITGIYNDAGVSDSKAKPAGIEQIAIALGISIGTVDRALRSTGLVTCLHVRYREGLVLLG